MNDKLMEAQDILLNKINQMCGKFGLNNIMAQLYAILYLNNKPLSLDDMVERLKISKGSVSVNIRILERYGAVRSVWIKGSRKDFYEAEADISKVIIERIRSMAQSRLTEVDDMISASYGAINSIACTGDEEKAAIETFKDRLGKLRSFHDQASSLFELFKMSLIANNASIDVCEEVKEVVLKE